MAKILVADDEQKIREVIREYSEFNGHEVTEAADGMTAVGLCKLNDYDLIIMDIMMPKLDGFSACKEIRKIKDIPVSYTHLLVIAASSTLYPFSLAYAFSSSTTDTELVSLELYSAPIVLYPGVASSASSMI